jgi:hypothetical protein
LRALSALLRLEIQKAKPGANPVSHFRRSYELLWAQGGMDVVDPWRLSEKLTPPGKGHSTQ